MWVLGIRVWGASFGVAGSEFGVWSYVWCGKKSGWIGAGGSGFRVWGVGFQGFGTLTPPVWDLGLRV